MINGGRSGWFLRGIEELVKCLDMMQIFWRLRRLHHGQVISAQCAKMIEDDGACLHGIRSWWFLSVLSYLLIASRSRINLGTTDIISTSILEYPRLIEDTLLQVCGQADHTGKAGPLFVSDINPKIWLPRCVRYQRRRVFWVRLWMMKNALLRLQLCPERCLGTVIRCKSMKKFILIRSSDVFLFLSIIYGFMLRLFQTYLSVVLLS